MQTVDAHQAVGWLDETPDKDTRVLLLVALRDITDGKIYVEAERAKLTRMLAKVCEVCDRACYMACRGLHRARFGVTLHLRLRSTVGVSGCDRTVGRECLCYQREPPISNSRQRQQ